MTDQRPDDHNEPLPVTYPQPYEPPTIEPVGNLRDLLGKSGSTFDFGPGEFRP